MFCLQYYSAGLELCSIYSLDDPVEFVEKWMSFSISKLDGADPTIQSMIDFENKELRNQNNVSMKTKKVKSLERSVLKVYNQESDDEENEILSAYVCITPKVSWTFFLVEFSPSTLISTIIYLW